MRLWQDPRMTDAPLKSDQGPRGTHIRSFVRRQGKITQGQRRALERLSGPWVAPFWGEPISLSDLFKNDRAVVLEIGFGMGETTATIAQRNPQLNFLGLEVYPAGVGALLQRIEAEHISNIKIIQHDAVDVVRKGLPLESLQGIHLFFPDPWPKKKHHKRRLIQPGFAHDLAQRIVKGGYLHCATDWPDYAQQMLDVLSAEPLLQNRAQAGGFCERPPWRPQTKFEARGLRLGNPVADLVFVRKTEA
ncbi:MAG: tRNA (guanosine(46)-N7)-methyltransferase TrmB [Betaproteobacteria bacterium]|nr:tRNA (guanosine(46)-N7)-methyltransferase TrmB [Betaproteobacteria bacterium]NBT75607.1 tRNA (guanosine(46)-N7)-methyltransferase TrmB [Betaproteobacteria bacterium]